MIEAQDFERHESLGTCESVSLRAGLTVLVYSVENASLEEKALPLYQCLDKFTEEERLDEVIACGGSVFVFSYIVLADGMWKVQGERHDAYVQLLATSTRARHTSKAVSVHTVLA
jgi:hypothetical protein